MFRRLTGMGPETVTVFVNEVAITAQPGDCVASVLLRAPPHFSRNSPGSDSPRAPYCMMGVCMECAAIVNGVHSTLTCQTEVAEGMHIVRQIALPSVTGAAADVTGASVG